MAALKYNIWLVGGAALSLVISAAYMMLAYKRMFFGKVNLLLNNKIDDLSLNEITVLLILSVLILLIGLHPSIILSKIDVTIKNILIVSGL